MQQNHETEQRAESRCWDGEEVDHGDLTDVIIEKALPRL